MKFNTIAKLFSLLFLASFMPLLLNVGSNTAYAQSTHTITINNNCSDTIWVGANPKVQSVTVGGQSQTTLGGWEMPTNSSATVLVPLNYNSGRFWARTGCNFMANNVCPPFGPDNNPPANCCDTGGCTDSAGNFTLDCDNTGIPPATLAEITFTQNIQESYDVSMVDGGNVSVDMIPDPSTYDCSNNSNCIFTTNLPGKNSSACTQDSDCYPLFGFGYKWKCDPNLKMCVNPFFCGSPGCTDKNGCAPQGITQSTLSHSTWGGTSEFAVSQANCPADMQMTDTQNQGSTYVGCIAPQKFCQKACTINSDCGPPYTQNCGTSGFCEKNGVILGADCQTVVGNTTNEQLWACTGVNAGSCFTPGSTNTNCCGCPGWAPGYPNPAPNGACVVGNNSNWQSNAQPIFSAFNDASPTAYAFPFDDAIKLFDCQAKTGGVTNYTINFCCINSDGDDVCDKSDTDSDNDCIPNSQETFAAASLNQTREAGMDLNDIDGDGVTNEFDLDSDNDGLPDIVDAGGAVLDTDFDGEVDDTTDVDLDGLADIGDPSEGGGLLISPDTDGDGIPNTLDIDSDNDGRTDFEESGGFGDSDGDGLVDDKTDSNGDGYLDIFDPDLGGTPLVIVDSNGDGLPDRLDASEGSGSGCSLAPKSKTLVSSLIYLLIPAIVLWRRFRSKTNS
jgi:hypothetical protein